MDPVGITEIARMFGVSRQRAHQLSEADDFPKAVELQRGRVWERASIVKWAEKRGRKYGKASASGPS